MEEFNSFIKASPKLAALIRKILIEEKPFKTKRQQYMIMASRKASNLFNSINLLNIQGYIKEAAQLVRSQMELQFITQYLFQDKTDKRLEQYLDYYNVYRKKLYDNFKANDIQVDLFKDIYLGEKITEKEIQMYAQSAQSKHRYPRHGWNEKSLYQMVNETNGVEFYRHYYYLYSEAIHSSIANLYEYFPNPQQKKPSLYLLMSNTMVSFLACILIFQQYCKEFKLPLLKDIETLMTKVGLDVERE